MRYRPPTRLMLGTQAAVVVGGGGQVALKPAIESLWVIALRVADKRHAPATRRAQAGCWGCVWSLLLLVLLGRRVAALGDLGHADGDEPPLAVQQRHLFGVAPSPAVSSLVARAAAAA
jgi:hypothetical protein